jgi:hypothetical protein
VVAGAKVAGGIVVRGASAAGLSPPPQAMVNAALATTAAKAFRVSNLMLALSVSGLKGAGTAPECGAFYPNLLDSCDESPVKNLLEARVS